MCNFCVGFINGALELHDKTLRQITDLRQRLAESQKTVLELEAEREQRQRDYDKKLLLAKSKIENVQVRVGEKQKSHRCETKEEMEQSATDFFVSGREGVFELGNSRAEAEGSIPAGSAAAPQQAAGVPGEGDPAPKQGEGKMWINTCFIACFSIFY